MRSKIKKFEDEVGKKYNFLTVFKEAPPYIGKNGYNSRRWLFKCDCGNIKSISPSNVFNNNIKSCGCKKTELTTITIQAYYKKRYKTPVEDRLYSAYKKDTNKHGKRKFDLTKDEFSKLVNSNCHYCGEPPFTERYNKTKSVSKKLNGVDRVNSALHYTTDNVVPCCKHCNIAKLDRDVNEFKKWVKLLYNNLYPEQKGR